MRANDRLEICAEQYATRLMLKGGGPVYFSRMWNYFSCNLTGEMQDFLMFIALFSAALGENCIFFLTV
jgi:hypothetical protein